MADQTTSQLTQAEQAELAAMVAELHGARYVDLPEFTYPRSAKVLRVGTRIRHDAERWPGAIERGTGYVVALTHKPGSGWSLSYGMPDIELIMLRDQEQFGSRLSQLAHYHVAVI